MALRRFGHIDVVGREIIVNGVSTTVIGVLPPDFRLPTDFAGAATEVFLPLRLDRAAVTARGSHFLVGVARLRGGVAPDQAAARLDAITRDLVAAFPGDYPRDMRFDPAPHATALRRLLGQLDPDVPPGPFLTMDDVRSGSVAGPRFITTLLGAFAAIALLLAAIGIYGLVSCGVGLRRQELGVRMALGARATTILGLVLRQSLLAAAAGIGIGTAAALLLTRTLKGLLYEVSPADPATLITVIGVLAAAVVAACVMPARSALRTDPMVSIRAE